jgi:hypothetical protein
MTKHNKVPIRLKYTVAMKKIQNLNIILQNKCILQNQNCKIELLNFLIKNYRLTESIQIF